MGRRKDGRLDAPFSGDTRKIDGATITFRRCEDGLLHTRACLGMPVKQAIATLCEEIETLPEQWVVQCISTPSLIWRDLQGIREGAPRDGGRYAEPLGIVETPHPESQLLAAVGYGHLYRRPPRLQNTNGDVVRNPEWIGKGRYAGADE